MIKSFNITFNKMTNGNPKRYPSWKKKQKKNRYSETQEHEPRPMGRCPNWLSNIFPPVSFIMVCGENWRDVKIGETWKCEFDHQSTTGNALWVHPIKKI